MIRPLGRGLAAVLLTTALAACSSSERSSVTTTVTVVATASSGAPAVAEALAFEAPTVGRGRFVGADYAGGAIALWFWAPY